MAALVGLLAFLPFLRGVLSGASLYFRDLALYFLPLRRLALDGLRAGEVRFWNPYLHEGVPLSLPAVGYPLDLVQVLRPDEAGISMILALHVPLAAVGFYFLCRGLLGVPSVAAAGGALLYALGGFVLSTVNLYVVLQAAAWAPLVVLTLARATRSASGGSVVPAALVTAVALSTTGVEIVGQAIVIGVLLGLSRDGRLVRGLAAAGAAVGLGALLCAPVLLMVAAQVGDSARSQGFATDVVLAQSVHPFTLLQTVVGGLYGNLSNLADEWWGQNFFPRGFPYILSLYLGPAALAIAVVGSTGRHPARTRLAVLAAAGVVLSLGRWAGLAAVVDAVPGINAFRYPVKVFFTAHPLGGAPRRARSGAPGVHREPVAVATPRPRGRGSRSLAGSSPGLASRRPRRHGLLRRGVLSAWHGARAPSGPPLTGARRCRDRRRARSRDGRDGDVGLARTAPAASCGAPRRGHPRHGSPAHGIGLESHGDRCVLPAVARAVVGPRLLSRWPGVHLCFRLEPPLHRGATGEGCRSRDMDLCRGTRDPDAGVQRSTPCSHGPEPGPHHARAGGSGGLARRGHLPGPGGPRSTAAPRRSRHGSERRPAHESRTGGPGRAAAGAGCALRPSRLRPGDSPPPLRRGNEGRSGRERGRGRTARRPARLSGGGRGGRRGGPCGERRQRTNSAPGGGAGSSRSRGRGQLLPRCWWSATAGRRGGAPRSMARRPSSTGPTAGTRPSTCLRAGASCACAIGPAA